MILDKMSARDLRLFWYYTLPARKGDSDPVSGWHPIQCGEGVGWQTDINSRVTLTFQCSESRTPASLQICFRIMWSRYTICVFSHFFNYPGNREQSWENRRQLFIQFSIFGPHRQGQRKNGIQSNQPSQDANVHK